MFWKPIQAASAALALAACASAAPTAPEPASPKPLAATAWRLVELVSSDDAIGTVRPDDQSKYLMTFAPDGTVSLQLDCNRGRGTWSATATDASHGQATFGQIGMTRAMCPKGSLDTRIARELPYVRSYVLDGGRLVLNMMADGGSLVWRPSPE